MIIQYIRRNERWKWNEEKDMYVRKHGYGPKKGIMIADIEPSTGKVIIGWSLCSPLDEYNVVKGRRIKDFDKEIAIDRALKFSDHEGYFYQNTFTENDPSEKMFQYINPDPKNIVELPPSIETPLRYFIKRVKSYYKDMAIPDWAELVYSDIPFMNEEDIEKDFLVDVYIPEDVDHIMDY